MSTKDTYSVPADTFEEVVGHAISRQNYKLAALSYLAKAEVNQHIPERAIAYATMAQAFATLEAAEATWAGN
jgi:hypothetical protein